MSLRDRWAAALVAIVLAYTVIESVYVLRLPLVMDEFDGAYEAYHLQHAVPYRDFQPYKTVLGYYFEAIPALIQADVWTRIERIKLWIVLFNAAMLAASALCLKRLYQPTAVAFALVLLVICSNFLERSAELRVDMLTAWAGLWSMLLLLRGRVAISAVLCGASFLVSQKGALYFVAAFIALGTVWVFAERTTAAFRRIVIFGAVFTATLLVYLIAWSAVAPIGSVFRATFVTSTSQALSAVYAVRAHFWGQVLFRNPAYFALALIAIAALLRKRSDLLLGTYGAVMLIEGAAYPQPWPYFFPLLLPTIYVLHAAFFSSVALERWQWAFIVTCAVLYPALRIPIVLGRSNAYQRYNVALAGALLGPHDTYVAGTDIIHDHEQSLPELERLDGVMLARLRAVPAPALDALIRRLDAHPPKLIVANYRVYGMPLPLRRYFDEHYSHLSASILVYAPLITEGSHDVRLRFGGRYRIDTPRPEVVTINGTMHRSGELLQLAAARYTVAGDGPVRIRLLPNGIESVIDRDLADEQPFYPNVYDY